MTEAAKDVAQLLDSSDTDGKKVAAAFTEHQDVDAKRFLPSSADTLYSAHTIIVASLASAFAMCIASAFANVARGIDTVQRAPHSVWSHDPAASNYFFNGDHRP